VWERTQNTINFQQLFNLIFQSVFNGVLTLIAPLITGAGRIFSKGGKQWIFLGWPKTFFQGVYNNGEILFYPHKIEKTNVLLKM